MRLNILFGKLMVLALLAGLAACTKGLDRKVNGSNEAVFEQSLAEMKKNASQEDVAKLDEALYALAVSDVSIGYEGGILGAFRKISRGKPPEQLGAALMAAVDGKSGREIVEMGRKRLQVEGARQLAAGDKEIALLKQMRDENTAKKGALEGIEVLDATLRFSSVGPERLSVMDFKVRNGSAGGLSHLYLRGTASEAAGGKILASEDFNYKLSESPLLPGDIKAIRLPQGSRSKWNQPEIWGKDQLLFKVELVNADNLAGQKLTTAFTTKDAARLAQLEANRQALSAMVGAAK
jgi:hypothetical protein